MIPPILAKIVETKKDELEILKKKDFSGLSLNTVSLEKSLLGKKISGKISIIAECKKASPSAGVIRQDYDAVAIARIYEANGAAAISVLTDRKYFQGSVEDLKNVVQAVNLPVIRKDFIIDPLQIQEARYYGAAAILLIARILSVSQLAELRSYAAELGMDSLVEIHNEKEAEDAIQAGARIIGINTRDLDTFAIHDELVAKIAPLLPKNTVRVAESGIHSRDSLLQASQFADSALIGSYFMQSESVAKAFAGLVAF